MDIFARGKLLSAFPDRTDLGYFGWFWFEYGDFAGKKEYVNLVRQTFFPEDYNECTGYGWLFKPGVKAIINPVWSEGVHADACTVAQGVIDVMKGRVGGLAVLGGAGFTSQAPRVVKRIGAGRKRLNLNLGG